jgi:hypothetical protein
MADINFGILDTQMPGRIAAIPQQQQAQQAQNAMQFMQLQQSMQQNALAKAKMEEYTRGTAEKNALRGRMTQPGFNIYDPAHQAEIMSLSPELAPGIIKHALDVETAKSTTAKNVAQTGVAQAGITKAKRDFGNEARRSLSFNPSDANITAWNEDAVKRGFITQQEADLEVQDMLRVPLDQRKAIFERAGAPAPTPQQPRQPNLATDLLIPGPNGTMVPNTALIGVRTGLAAAGRPAGTTVVMPPLEKSEQQEKGKLNVKVYGDIAGTADRARKILPALETSEAILNNGFKTGFGTDVQTQAARVLSSLGVPEADKYATNSQLFLAQGRQALLQRQLEQKGAQSEGDAQRINQTFIQLGNTPEANKFLVATAKAQAKQDIERQKFYGDWWSKSKTYEGAEEAWLAGTGGKSLFDRPDMKSFAPKTPQSDISSAAAAELERRKGKSR